MNLHPSLAAVLEPAGVDPARVHILHGLAGDDAPIREDIFVTSGDPYAVWNVPSLRALLRGDRVPPPLTDYPPEYVPAFFTLEKHLLDFARTHGAPLDRDVEEVYGALRRRPDGKSGGPLHDAMWQATALMLGLFPLSQAELDAILARLARSARSHQTGPGSRAYLRFIADRLGAR